MPDMYVPAIESSIVAWRAKQSIPGTDSEPGLSRPVPRMQANARKSAGECGRVMRELE